MSDFEKIAEISSDYIKVKQHIQNEAPRFLGKYFENIRKNSKINPSKDSSKKFTESSLIKILTSIAILPEFLDVDYIIQIIIKNYNFDYNTSSDLYYEVMDMYEPIQPLFSTMKIYTDRLRSTHQYKDIINIYRGFLKPSHYEQKNLGEVYTPFELIEKALAEFPPEFWTNPNFKFFDPAAGMGGFLAIAYSKFWSGISDKIRDPIMRHNHIINNMLYAAELDTTNVELLRKIFGNELHIFHGDSINLFDPVRNFGIQGFNGIGSNFPFEKQQVKDAKKHAGDSLWPNFVMSTMNNWLLYGGISGMLLPAGWRKATDANSRCPSLWPLLTSVYTTKYIEMFDKVKSKIVFNGVVSVQCDLVVVVKQQSYASTMVIDTKGNRCDVNLHNMSWLPNSNILKVDRLINDQSEKCNVLYNRTVYQRDISKQNTIRPERDAEFKHPVIHGIRNDKNGGPRIMYTNVKREEGGFGIRKVIFNCYGAWNKPILDLEGKYGMSQSAFAIVVDSDREGRNIVEYFTSQKLKMFQSDFSWATSNPFIFWKLFRSLPKNFYQRNL